jgi:hypothetical protein
MSSSFVTYTGTGSQTDYTLPFNYLASTDVFVFVNGSAVAYSWINTSSIRTAVAPAGGTVIQIRRITQKSSPPVNFTDGAVLLESDLDTLTTWSLYIAQESSDASNLFPYPAPSTVLGWNESGSALQNYPITSGTAVAAYGSEKHTAIDAQTVFNLATPYIPNGNTISVYVNGLLVSPSGDYTETSGTVITFTNGLSVGDSVVFHTWLTTSPTSVPASLSSYTPAGTGAVATTVQSKLRESVSVLDFGADPTGATDSTAAIQAALDSIPNYASAFCPSKPSGGAGEVEVLFPPGNYVVSACLVNNQRGWSKMRGLGRVNIYSTSTTYILDMASCYYCDVTNLNLISSTAGIGIYMNRAVSNPYCDYNAFDNVNVTLDTGMTANGGQGTIALYMNRVEQNMFTNCAFNADCTLRNESGLNASFPVTNGTQYDNTITSNTVNTFIQCNWTKNGSAQYGMILQTAAGFQFLNNYCNDRRITVGAIPYFLAIENCTRLTFEANFDDVIRFANVIGYNFFNKFELILPSANLDGGGVFTFDTVGSNYLANSDITVYCSGVNTGKPIFKNTSGAAYMAVLGNNITTYSTSPMYSLINGAFTGNILRTETGLTSINFGASDLNKYQEGTWTPNIGGTATYTNQEGHYTRIGNLVTISGRLKINVIGTGVGYLVYGLPFTSANNAMQSSISINSWLGLTTTPAYAVGSVAPNSTLFLLNAITAGSATLGLLTILTSGSEIYFSGSYTAA